MPRSPSSPTSSESPEAVVDTVVLRYFLLVNEVDLLLNLVGSPIAVPRIVYDPDEPAQLPDDARSEITRSISYQRKASRDRARDAAARQEAIRNAASLEGIVSLHQTGTAAVVDLADDELDLVARLTSPTTCRQFGIRFPLDAGEAACLAIAVRRDLVLVTDDADALRALDHHSAGHPYERIRRLLIRAADSGLCTKMRANEIHLEMCRLGFWDRESPFPSRSGRS